MMVVAEQSLLPVRPAGPARPLARAMVAYGTRAARAHGLGGALGRRAGRRGGEDIHKHLNESEGSASKYFQRGGSNDRKPSHRPIGRTAINLLGRTNKLRWSVRWAPPPEGKSSNNGNPGRTMSLTLIREGAHTPPGRRL